MSKIEVYDAEFGWEEFEEDHGIHTIIENKYLIWNDEDDGSITWLEKPNWREVNEQN